jgi:hypothetical protein
MLSSDQQNFNDPEKGSGILQEYDLIQVWEKVVVQQLPVLGTVLISVIF